MFEKNQKIAVCDLGTNVWRLRIVDTANYMPEMTKKTQNIAPHTLLTQVLANSISLRENVFMARENTERMTDATLLRCKTALRIFKTEMDKHAIAHTWIAATAGFRKAANADELIAWANTELGLTIQTISGAQEAELIAAGIRAAIAEVFVVESPKTTAPNTTPIALFIDIGGGSVEYIISSDTETLWAKSFPIGVSALYDKFGKTTAFSASEQSEIVAFIHNTVQEIQPLLAQYKPTKLAMTAGTFGVLYALLDQKQGAQQSFSRLSTNDFERLYHDILTKSQTDLYTNPLIPAHRVELLQISLFLIAQALAMLPVSTIITPRWSMEEGMILALLKDW
jgi:exopolyphosphatase / guanosine-5'-triphosphate,3'-diphosphate pyrophosphatase